MTSVTTPRYYAVGWSPDEVEQVPENADFADAYWIHTGITWVPLPPATAAVWRKARWVPVTQDQIVEALRADEPADDPLTLFRLLHQRRVWLAWPIWWDPYNGLGDELNWMTLVPTGSAPDGIPDALWRQALSVPALAQRLNRILGLADRISVQHLVNAVPQWLADHRAHWIYGRQGLPTDRPFVMEVASR
ncbi:MAG: hypothetical protein OWQ57_08455 [Sulfobacillus sp.]|nr:hypothetical protein [Sulfobacillus sp.]